MAKSSTTKKRVFLGREAWVKHTAAWRDSGLTKEAYANKAGINLATFHNWIAKLRREKSGLSTATSAFVPVTITPEAIPALAGKSSDQTCELNITLPNGIQCNFSVHHSPQQIVPWLDYLRMLP
jgi:hypothetical protein